MLKLKPLSRDQMLSEGIPSDHVDSLAVEGEHTCFLLNECGEAGQWAVDEITSLRNQLRIAKRSASKEP